MEVRLEKHEIDGNILKIYEQQCVFILFPCSQIIDDAVT